MEILYVRVLVIATGERNSVMSERSKTEAKVPTPDEALESELDAPIWAVVSFEKCEAAGLSYPQALERIAELERAGVYGLCVVTDEAANRLRGG